MGRLQGEMIYTGFRILKGLYLKKVNLLNYRIPVSNYFYCMIVIYPVFSILPVDNWFCARRDTEYDPPDV